VGRVRRRLARRTSEASHHRPESTPFGLGRQQAPVILLLVQVNSFSAILGSVMLAGLLAFLVWGVAHEWWRNRGRRRPWTQQSDSVSVGRRSDDEDWPPDPDEEP